MKCNLIADAGSTKSAWCVYTTADGELTRFVTPGLNALMASAEEVKAMASEVKKHVGDVIGDDACICTVNFYGAGCATDEICRRLASQLREAFAAESVDVASDIVGAARSLLGTEPGIACILGTGSNSALYDGRQITANIPPLGYILGDEGSGASLGKRLVADILKGLMPDDITEAWHREFGLDKGEVLRIVYRESGANRRLASFAPFIAANMGRPEMEAIVASEFDSFMSRCATRYEGAKMLPTSFTGSIAFHFSRQLRAAAERAGLRIGKITKEPLQGLLEYHLQNHDNDAEI